MSRPPSAVQASAYSATRHYLKAVQAAGTDEAGAVLKKMREIPVNDGLFNNGKVREDGRVTYDVLLLQVKSPADVKKDGWDTTNIIKVVPASEAFRPIQDGGCPHVKVN